VDNKDSDVYAMNNAGGDIIFLALSGPIYLMLIFLIEKLLHMHKVTEFFSHELEVPYIPKNYDDDVKKEMDEIENSSP